MGLVCDAIPMYKEITQDIRITSLLEFKLRLRFTKQVSGTVSTRRRILIVLNSISTTITVCFTHTELRGFGRYLETIFRQCIHTTCSTTSCSQNAKILTSKLHLRKNTIENFNNMASPRVYFFTCEGVS